MMFVTVILIGCGGVTMPTAPEVTNGKDMVMPAGEREAALISNMTPNELFRHFAAEFASTQDENAQCYVYHFFMNEFEQNWSDGKILELANNIEEAQGYGLPDESIDPPC